MGFFFATVMSSISYLAAGVVGVFGQLPVQPLEEELVCDFAHVHTGFIQNREDALVLLFHQIHNNLVVEVINLCKNKGRRRTDMFGFF